MFLWQSHHQSMQPPWTELFEWRWVVIYASLLGCSVCPAQVHLMSSCGELELILKQVEDDFAVPCWQKQGGVGPFPPQSLLWNGEEPGEKRLWLFSWDQVKLHCHSKKKSRQITVVLLQLVLTSVFHLSALRYNYLVKSKCSQSRPRNEDAFLSN